MLRVFSYGGGVQSTAALVLAAQGEIDFRTFLFCNVGEDSEDPLTLQYFREYAQPFAAEHGIELFELERITRKGQRETLRQRIDKPDTRSVPIPVRMKNGAPGNRTCTADFKIKVVARWIREHRATRKDTAIVGLGISIDEFQRMRKDSGIKYITHEYPLIKLRLARHDCAKIIVDAGLPLPPKSACYFCPFHSMSTWQDMKRYRPELFNESIVLEQTINATRDRIGKDHVYLTGRGMPIDQAVSTDQQSLFDDTCESGYCMT